MLLTSIFFLTLGAIFGSFLANYTYRVVRGTNMGGRSVCDHCGKKLKAIDNIPVISYVILRGKSRCCQKPISFRYPFIESITAIGFIAIYQLSLSTITPIQSLTSNFHSLALPLLLFLFLTTLAIFIVDLENQIIPDEVVFTIFLVALTLLTIGSPFPYTTLTISFLAGSFFLFLNLITKGRGMGLGDAKLAVALGLVLGTLTPVWIAFSFIIGAIVAVFLLLIGKAKFGKHIAFGPFMILAFWLILVYGEPINRFLLFGIY